MQNLNIQFPPIGMRIIKSSVAVLLCLAVYVSGFRTGIPFYATIAALWCVRPFVGSSLTMAVQRITGTLIGAGFGLLVIIFEINVWSVHGKLPGYIIVGLMIIVVIYATVLMKRVETSYFSCVVFLSITITHINDVNPYIFVLNRVVDTSIGILIGILVNTIHIPRRCKVDTLFVTGLDGTLLTEDEKLTPYSKVTLNRMIDDGLKFTIATLRTPASLMEPLRDIQLNLPIIAMDGAALYDFKEKEYKKVYIISRPTVKEVMNFLDEREFHYFINTVLDDVLIIYYDVFKNPVQQELFQKYRCSPYRNYVKREHFKDGEVIYLMILDTNERISGLYNELSAAGFCDKLKLVRYPSGIHPDYTTLRIYNKNASKRNMIRYLEQQLQTKNTVTFGNITGQYDLIPFENNPNKVVKTLHKMFAGRS